MVKETEKRLDAIPSQRPSMVSAPTPVIADPPTVVDVPQPHAPPSPLVEPQPVPPAPRSVALRRPVLVGLAAALVLAVAVGGGVYAAEQRAQEAEAAALAAGLRVDEHVLAAAQDADAERSSDAVAAQADYQDSRAAASSAAQAAVDRANATLAAVPNAGDAPRAALAGASGAVAAALAAPDVSMRSLRSLAEGVAVPEKAAVDAQAAWQAAENARIAAEQAAAAAAAEAAAAARATTRATARTPAQTPARSTARSTAPSTTSGGTAPVAPSGGIPSGGKACSGSGGSGAGESSVSAIGSAINAYRASLDLLELFVVVQRQPCVRHLIQMANVVASCTLAATTSWRASGDGSASMVSGVVRVLLLGTKSRRAAPMRRACRSAARA